MKKLKDFNSQILNDLNSMTIMGGHDCNGTETHDVTICFPRKQEHYDWEDEGCCEEQ